MTFEPKAYQTSRQYAACLQPNDRLQQFPHCRPVYLKKMNHAALCALMAISSLATASPVTYIIDPNHTHPEFEADHLGGVSIWRGLFKRTSGTIILDAAAQTGTLDVAIDVASVEFGNDKLNE